MAFEAHGIGGFVLDLSLRALAAALAVALVLRLLRVRAPTVRHAAWTVVLAAMPLMPLLPAVVPALTLPIFERATPLARRDSPARDVVGLPAGPTVEIAVVPPAGETVKIMALEPAAKSFISDRKWLPVLLGGVYSAGLLLVLGRLLLGWRLASRMIRRAMRGGPLRLRSRLAIRAGVRGPLYESPEVVVPMTAGAIHPIVILPATWRDWSDDTLTAVLAHEMAHVRRRDALIALLARVNRALFWFHPLAWWLERQLAVTAEHACDEAAARTIAEPRRYAEILVEMADAVRRHRGRVAWQGVGVDGAGLLEGRIERVLRGAARTSRVRGWATLTACAAAILVVVACREQQPPPLREDPDVTKRLADQQERTKIFEAARDMKQEQAEMLEQRLATNPQDFEARRQLVIYYSQSSTVAWDRKVPGLRRHALWLIEHHPEHDVAPPALSPQHDPEGFAAAKRLWESHLAKPDASAFLVYRAARFFAPHDKPYAEQLILRGGRIDPVSEDVRSRLPAYVAAYEWDAQLAHLYASALRGSESVSGTYNDLRTHKEWLNRPYAAEVRRKLAASKDARLLARVGSVLVRPWAPDDRLRRQFHTEGVTYLRRALEIDPNLELAKSTLFVATARERLTEADRLATLAHERYMISEDITEHARKDAKKAAAERAEAKQQAEQALQFAAGHAGDPAYSAAVMTAHQVLAAIAIRDGDRERAIEHLRESVKVPPSDQIRYSTPSSWMRPVNYLLQEGERERVVQFLEAFAPLLGTPSRERMFRDAQAVRVGRMPSSYQHMVSRLSATSRR